MNKAGAEEEIVVVECDLTRVPALQDAWRFLANRRPQAYARLTDG
jgi:hypothetical protein